MQRLLLFLSFTAFFVVTSVFVWIVYHIHDEPTVTIKSPEDINMSLDKRYGTKTSNAIKQSKKGKKQLSPDGGMGEYYAKAATKDPQHAKALKNTRKIWAMSDAEVEAEYARRKKAKSKK